MTKQEPSESKKKKEPEEDLSEEDQNLKSELELLVTRLSESNVGLYKPALESLRTLIRTSTSSMTSVPKPLKFLRPHYGTLQSIYERWKDSDQKVFLLINLEILG
jgi:26S proteasome regulatory subunit N1